MKTTAIPLASIDDRFIVSGFTEDKPFTSLSGIKINGTARAERYEQMGRYS